jgi:hypothetical protein
MDWQGGGSLAARARPLLTSLIAISLSGCGVYLHRPELQTATADIKTKFSALSAPAYLDAQQKTLDAFALEEDRALAEYLVASRDYTLLNPVRGPNGEDSAVDSAKSLQGSIAQHLKSLVGTSDLGAADITRYENERFIRSDAERNVASIRATMDAPIRDYAKFGGTGGALKCETVLKAPTPPVPDPTAAKTAYATFHMVCLRLQQEVAKVEACGISGASGRLLEVCDRLRALNADVSQTARKNELTKAIQALKKALEKPRPTEVQRRLAAANDLIAEVEGLKTDEDYRKVLDALDEVFTADLAETLNGVAEKARSAGGVAVDPTTRDALALLGAIADFDAAQRTKPLDQPSALLIGLAKVRHELNMVNLDIAHNTRLKSLYSAQAAALRTQLHYLVRAYDKLCRGGSGCAPNPDNRAAALTFYVASYNHGLIPFEVLRFREVQFERSLAVERAKQSEADYRALLQPAIDQLAAYGDGGLKPDLLGPFLANLPVAGAILGR